MKKVIIHVCCGPCSTEVIHRLSEENELTLFFFNPNIFPREEYDRRLSEARKYATERGIIFIREETTAFRRWKPSGSDRMETTGFLGLAIRTNQGTNALPGGSAEFSRWSFIEGDYDHAGWLEAVKGLENEPEGGKRCRACFAHRLGATAMKARETGAEAFTTTLTISPHKNAAAVNSAGEEAGKRVGASFIAADFKKMDGFKKSCICANEAGMYRQEYCGCEFSKRGRGPHGSL